MPSEEHPGGTEDVSLHESERLVRTGDDATMNFASGSVIFLISDARFKVSVTEYVHRRVIDNSGT